MTHKITYAAVLITLILLTGCAGDENSTLVGPVFVAPVETAGLLQASDGEITLYWEAKAGVKITGFNIYRKESYMDRYSLIAAILKKENLYNDVKLDYENEYTYAITAVNGNAESELYTNDEISFISPLNIHRPRQPKIVMTKGTNLPDINKIDISLFWEGNFRTDVIGFNVFRSDIHSTLDTGNHFLSFVTDSSFVDTSIIPGEFYKYQIQSVDKGNKKSTLSEDIMEIALEIPTVFQPINNQTTTLNPIFSWHEVFGADKYHLLLYENAYSNPFFTVETEIARYDYSSNAPNLEVNKVYYFRIATVTENSEDFNSISPMIAFIPRGN